MLGVDMFVDSVYKVWAELLDVLGLDGRCHRPWASGGQEQWWWGPPMSTRGEHSGCSPVGHISYQVDGRVMGELGPQKPSWR